MKMSFIGQHATPKHLASTRRCVVCQQKKKTKTGWTKDLKPHKYWQHFSRVSEDRRRKIMRHQQGNHDDGVVWRRNHSKMILGGPVDLTLIVLKLAVVWTAKRTFYSWTWKTRHGRNKVGGRWGGSTKAENTTPVKRVMEPPPIRRLWALQPWLEQTRAPNTDNQFIE